MVGKLPEASATPSAVFASAGAFPRRASESPAAAVSGDTLSYPLARPIAASLCRTGCSSAAIRVLSEGLSRRGRLSLSPPLGARSRPLRHLENNWKQDGGSEPR